MYWDKEKIDGYYSYVKNKLPQFTTEVDCADLGLSLIIDYSISKKLPLKLKYWKDSEWKWYQYNPATDKGEDFKKQCLSGLGASHIIDNTEALNLKNAQSGDFIMSKGHTRVIHSISPLSTPNDYEVVYYQGHLPAVTPEKITENYLDIEDIYQGKPRRWRFKQFHI